jgi:hypothetical protein
MFVSEVVTDERVTFAWRVPAPVPAIAPQVAAVDWAELAI